MRLGQIARKVNVKPVEIRTFIQEQFNVELDNDPNVKIEDEHAAAIIEQFKVEEVIEEKTPEVEEIVEELEIDPSIDTDLESLKEVVDEVVTEKKVVIPDLNSIEAEKEEVLEEEPKLKQVEPKKVEIDYEAEEAPLDEGGNYEEVPVDPDAELISAKVEKLEGLKVVGKIELEDDKITKKLMSEEVELPSVDEIESEIDALDGDIDTSGFSEIAKTDDAEKEAIFAELDAQMESKSDGKVKAGKVKTAEEVETHLDKEVEDSIYKDEKGIYHFTTQQRENRKESLRVKAEKERIRKQKEKKARHYKQQVATKVSAPKKKKEPSKKVQQKQAKQKLEKEAPKGLWGKFLNWINDND